MTDSLTTVQIEHSRHSDEELWSIYRTGNQQALSFIYSRHVKPLYAYGRKFNADGDLVKDCIQDLFSELMQKSATVSETASVKNYLMKSLRRKLLAESQKRVFWPLSADYAFELIPSMEEQMIETQMSQEATSQVRKAVAQLTNRQQEIIYLKFYHDLDNQSIAEVMSLTYPAVCNLISKSLKSIRTILANSLFLLFLLTIDRF
ncbi:RNA polymerase sigma factor [Larkinella rosea]|uniref:Sigma-70 family RNA polymerase sigma factor n=1 Tax=Larkinella rosea TaxID=2025312 RepID=A0A3P1C0A2_9BACT|nr:sigma-70 family RNA polymerase sigma factor [Larkinella rosea]RRB06556.1 sigma-70 family RNA polymerase sigma factor [Larkinella rosea]